MASSSVKNTQEFISANDLAQYVVCPKAWELKYVSEAKKPAPTVNKKAASSREEWLETHSSMAQAKLYTTVIFSLLLLVLAVVYLKEFFYKSKEESSYPNFLNLDSSIPPELLILLIVLGLLIFFWDFFDRHYQELSEDSNISPKAKIVGLKDNEEIPSKTFSSKSLGIRARPDALLKEKGLLIPVDVVPLSSKVRDRHVIKIISYLSLIEEEQKKPSPHGSLMMGKKRRNVKILYTEEKKLWLKSLLKEIESIKNGVPAQAKAGKIKCKNCDFKESCDFVYKDIPRSPR